MTLRLEEELVAVVADYGDGKDVVKIVTREEAQRNRELTWTCQVTAEAGGYELVTLRGNGAKRYSGQWEIGITETPRSGESFEITVRRGFEEELTPISEKNKVLWVANHYFRNPEDPRDWKNVSIHRCSIEGKIGHNPEEIAAALLLKPKDISWAIATGTMQFTPMNISVHNKLMEAGIYQ